MQIIRLAGTLNLDDVSTGQGWANGQAMPESWDKTMNMLAGNDEIISVSASIAQVLLGLAAVSALSSELLGAIKLIRGLVFITLLSTTVFTTSTILRTQYGDVAFQMCFVVTNFLSKIATCAVLMALAPTKKHRLPTLVVEVTALFWAIYSIYWIANRTLSVSTGTLLQTEESFNLLDFWRGYAKFDILIDLGIVLSPINCVRSTALPLQKRVILCLAFLPRILATLSALARYWLLKVVVQYSSDISREGWLYNMATVTQVFFGVLSALAPHLTPFRSTILGSCQSKKVEETKQEHDNDSTNRWSRSNGVEVVTAIHLNGYLALFGAAVYAVDKRFYASSLTRSTRTFVLALTVALDYKINFRENPPFADDIAEVHTRSAQKLFELLRKNGGLYLKIGQAIAMQSAILPPEFQKMFSRMFDDAPQNSWDEVSQVISKDFGGRSPEEVFGISFDGDPNAGVMEKKARASASVAQVHWARLRDGREVAIKVQKKEIAQQVGWDLWAFKVVTRLYTWYFDLPFYVLVPYITERLQLECDFENEASNARKMAQLVKGEPRLRDRVYIPVIYDDLSSKRVLTAEWIEGVRLWDKEGITNRWEGGWRRGSPGSHGTPLDPAGTTTVTTPAIKNQHKVQSDEEQLKPDRSYWKGKDGKGGLGLDLREVMTTMIDLFSAQMFLWGLVHCDPHPGNLFVRRQPNGHSEIVLIDHGLYINMTPEFRHKYALFWKSLMTFDNKTLNEVVSSWGVNNAELFASATLMRPYEGGDRSFSNKLRGLSNAEKRKRQYEMQQAMRKGIREILADESKWPRELIFIGRNLRIVQGNNQYFGSPVNRIKLTGNWAARALSEDKQLPMSQRWRNYGSYLLMHLVLLGSDVWFYYSKFKQLLGRGKGMEDDVERHMAKIAKDYGVDMQHGVFEG
ncbi:hypothetical protein DV736_g5699, partial [Chaetothyriales sp. CBS 134916]